MRTPGGRATYGTVLVPCSCVGVIRGIRYVHSSHGEYKVRIQ
jgi:hypothetical protein